MAMITRILCPTDFSTSSMGAVAYAERMASETKAELLLVHAFDTPVAFSASGQEHPRDPRIEQQLNALLADSPLQTQITRYQHAGPPGEVICWAAQQMQCDLIVMGTHGRSGLKQALFGSVTEYVLRHARCPVLTLREHVPDEPPLVRPSVTPVLAPRFM